MKPLFIIVILVLAITVIIIIVAKNNADKEENILNFLDKMEKEKKEKIIRMPAAAGQFYPAEAGELKEMIRSFLLKANPPQGDGELAVLIVPHAAYQFSGEVAAFGFKEVALNKSAGFETVILLGNSHQEHFDGVSIFAEGKFKTPLGEVEVDSELAARLLKENKRFFFGQSAHQNEHSLEVQLPFLQEVLGNFKIVAALFGNTSRDDWKILGEAIAKNIGNKKILVVASSDLSHYPSFEDAKEADLKTIQAILGGKPEELEKTLRDLEKKGIKNAITFACAEEAIKSAMFLAQKLGAAKIELLKYANSGEVALGNKREVVGYAAIGFFKEKTSGNAFELKLSLSEQKELLSMARRAVESFVRTGKIPSFQTKSEALKQRRGVFVTIRKEGQLRGCIGQVGASEFPLSEVIPEMAVAAATEDERFWPVQESELPDLKYEISILSPLVKVNNWKEIKIGEHGVFLRNGLRQAVFLPQVAVENNWDLKRFLEELCVNKAGLEPSCYQDKAAEIYVFTAQVFGEN